MGAAQQRVLNGSADRNGRKSGRNKNRAWCRMHEADSQISVLCRLRSAAPRCAASTVHNTAFVVVAVRVRPSFCAGATGVLDPNLGSGSRVYRGVEHFPTLAFCML